MLETSVCKLLTVACNIFIGNSACAKSSLIRLQIRERWTTTIAGVESDLGLAFFVGSGVDSESQCFRKTGAVSGV